MPDPAKDALAEAEEALEFADEFAESIAHYEMVHGGVSRWAQQAMAVRLKARAALSSLRRAREGAEVYTVVLSERDGNRLTLRRPAGEESRVLVIPLPPEPEGKET